MKMNIPRNHRRHARIMLTYYNSNIIIYWIKWMKSLKPSCLLPVPSRGEKPALGDVRLF